MVFTHLCVHLHLVLLVLKVHIFTFALLIGLITAVLKSNVY